MNEKYLAVNFPVMHDKFAKFTLYTLITEKFTLRIIDILNEKSFFSAYLTSGPPKYDTLGD